MSYLIIAIIGFCLLSLFTFSLCVAAGRADKSADTMARELEPQGAVAWRKHGDRKPTFASRRRRFNSNLARSN